MRWYMKLARAGFERKVDGRRALSHVDSPDDTFVGARCCMREGATTGRVFILCLWPNDRR